MKTKRNVIAVPVFHIIIILRQMWKYLDIFLYINFKFSVYVRVANYSVIIPLFFLSYDKKKEKSLKKRFYILYIWNVSISKLSHIIILTYLHNWTHPFYYLFCSYNISVNPSSDFFRCTSPMQGVGQFLQFKTFTDTLVKYDNTFSVI